MRIIIFFTRTHSNYDVLLPVDASLWDLFTKSFLYGTENARVKNSILKFISKFRSKLRRDETASDRTWFNFLFTRSFSRNKKAFKKILTSRTLRKIYNIKYVYTGGGSINSEPICISSGASMLPEDCLLNKHHRRPLLSCYKINSWSSSNSNINGNGNSTCPVRSFVPSDNTPIQFISLNYKRPH